MAKKTDLFKSKKDVVIDHIHEQLKGIKATKEFLSSVEGFGEKKVNLIHVVVHNLHALLNADGVLEPQYLAIVEATTKAIDSTATSAAVTIKVDSWSLDPVKNLLHITYKYE